MKPTKIHQNGYWRRLNENEDFLDESGGVLKKENFSDWKEFLDLSHIPYTGEEKRLMGFDWKEGNDKMTIVKSSRYFDAFDLDESIVVRFEHSRTDHEVCLMIFLYAPQDSSIEIPYELSKENCKYPYEVYHKLVFSDVTNYERKEPISINFRHMEVYEESPEMNSPLVIYAVENTSSSENHEFSAVLTGFGEISFHYSKLDVESKVAVPKRLKENGRIHIEVGTGNVGTIPELFDQPPSRLETSSI